MLSNSDITNAPEDVLASLSLANFILESVNEAPFTMVPSLNICSPKRSTWFCNIVCSCVNSLA